jgi:hypothetical protein
MIMSKDNNGKPIGFIETLISNDRVVTINATQQETTVTTRDGANGKVKTETFWGPRRSYRRFDVLLVFSPFPYHA